MIDKEYLLSEPLSSEISGIGNLYFNYNRILDAGMDYLDVDMKMTNLSYFIHEKLAHQAPIDADAFRDFNAKNGRRTDYGVAIEGNSGEYDNPLKFFAYAFSYAVKILKAIGTATDSAQQEKNLEVCEFLRTQIDVVCKYKTQFVFLFDKCEIAIQQGLTWQDIDNMWEDYIVEGLW